MASSLLSMRSVGACLVLAATISALTSCKETQAGNQSQPEPPTSVSEWHWAAFPVGKTVSLSAVSVRLEPKQFFEFRSASKGELTLAIAEKTLEISQGEVWGQLDVEQLRTREEELEVKKELESFSTTKLDEVDLPQQKFALISELEAARKKVALLDRLLKSEVTRELESLVGLRPGEVTQEELTKAREALALLESKERFVSDHDEAIRRNELRLREIEMERSASALDALKDASLFEAPFAGTLELKIPFEVGKESYPVRSRQVVASLSDFSSIRASVAVNNPTLLEHDPKRLALTLGNRSRTPFLFEEEETTSNSRTGQLERHYHFRYQDGQGGDDLAMLRRLSGTSMSAEISLALTEPCHLVPKTAVAVYAVGKSTLTRWPDLVADLWPGAVLVAEGTTTVAIKAP